MYFITTTILINIVIFAISWIAILRFDMRPIGVICSVLTIYLFGLSWANFLRLVSPSVVASRWTYVFKKLNQIRNENHGKFCLISSFGLIFLSVLGYIIPGKHILLILVMLIVVSLTRYTMQIEHVNRIEQQQEENELNDNRINNEDSTIEEFLPDTTESNLFVLERAGDEAIMINTPSITSFLINEPNDNINNNNNDNKFDDESEEEIPSELLPSTGSLPEVNTDDDSSEDDNIYNVSVEPPKMSYNETIESQLAASPTSSIYGQTTVNVIEISSDEDLNDDDDSITKGLNFNEAHFNEAHFNEPTFLAFNNHKRLPGTTIPSSTTIINDNTENNVIATNTTTSSNISNVPDAISGLVTWGVGNLYKQITPPRQSNNVFTNIDTTMSNQPNRNNKENIDLSDDDDVDESGFEIISHKDLMDQNNC